jgi:hypothetical protein
MRCSLPTRVLSEIALISVNYNQSRMKRTPTLTAMTHVRAVVERGTRSGTALQLWCTSKTMPVLPAHGEPCEEVGSSP